MKITETDKGNIKIVMSKDIAVALRLLLNNLSLDDYERITNDDEASRFICDLWDKLNEVEHLL